jgi:hypothetical protein
MMVANWVVDAEAATARGNSDSGTADGSKVCWVGASKARATPKTKTVVRMNALLTHPQTDASASVATANPSAAWQICKRRRRS